MTVKLTPRGHKIFSLYDLLTLSNFKKLLNLQYPIANMATTVLLMIFNQVKNSKELMQSIII